MLYAPGLAQISRTACSRVISSSSTREQAGLCFKRLLEFFLAWLTDWLTDWLSAHFVARKFLCVPWQHNHQLRSSLRDGKQDDQSDEAHATMTWGAKQSNNWWGRDILLVLNRYSHNCTLTRAIFESSLREVVIRTTRGIVLSIRDLVVRLLLATSFPCIRTSTSKHKGTEVETCSFKLQSRRDIR